MKSYRDLLVYQLSYEMAKLIYSRVTPKMPSNEQYGLISQMKRASTSVPLNIAEGYGKMDSNKELVRFLKMARGSCCEMTVLIDFANDFEYITKEEYKMLIGKYDEIGRMLTGLIKQINF